VSTTPPGPVYLRWRAGRPAPEEERFAVLVAALDAVEARWEALKDFSPQILDHRRVLMVSTAELLAAPLDPEGEVRLAGPAAAQVFLEAERWA
jgi:hypothetical protein